MGHRGVRDQALTDKARIVNALEEEKQETLARAATAQGVERVQLRAHLVHLERRLKWYRGRLTLHPRGVLQEPEQARRAAESRDRLVEVHRAVGVELAQGLDYRGPVPVRRRSPAQEENPQKGPESGDLG